MSQQFQDEQVGDVIVIIVMIVMMIVIVIVKMIETIPLIIILTRDVYIYIYISTF